MVDSKRLCVHIIDSAIARLEDGASTSGSGSEADSGREDKGVRGEQLVGIFDLDGFSVPRNADFAFAAFMVEAFFEYYPRRVGQVRQGIHPHGEAHFLPLTKNSGRSDSFICLLCVPSEGAPCGCPLGLWSSLGSHPAFDAKVLSAGEF